MGRRIVPSRRVLAAVALAAASVGLHALVVTGLAGLPQAAGTNPRPSAAVAVALLAPPPPPPAAPAVATRESPAAAPARAAPRPRPAPRPAAGPSSIPAAAQGPDAAAGQADAAPEPVPVEAGGSGAVSAAAEAEAGAGSVSEAVPSAAVPIAPPEAAAVPAAPAADAAEASAPALPPLPASARQRFRVYWGDFTDERSVARLDYRLLRDGDRYEIRTEGEAEGLISLVYSGTLSQVSIGRVGPRGLEPLQYSEQRGKRPERSVAFDPDAHRLTPGDGRGASVWLPPGTQDRLSVFYQIGLLARAQPERFAAGATRELPVATLRGVRVERFEVVGDAMLMAPGGPIRALHLHRPAPPGTDDPRIDLWLGYDFEMLPVRLRVEDAGRRVLDQVIERGG